MIYSYLSQCITITISYPDRYYQHNKTKQLIQSWLWLYKTPDSPNLFACRNIWTTVCGSAVHIMCFHIWLNAPPIWHAIH